MPKLSAAATDRQMRIVTLPQNGTVTLDITIGNVQVEGSARTDVAIEIVRHAPTEAGFTRIPIEIAESDEEVRIRAVQASGETDSAFRTDVTLRVPQSANLRAVRVLEGRLTLSGFHGSINADVRRGPIIATDVRGSIRLETGIGDVTVDRATLSDTGLLRLRAFNGIVRLTLGERPADARVMALALNGTIESTIPLTMKDTWGPRWGEATLGNGERVISVDVVNGRIEIRSP